MSQETVSQIQILLQGLTIKELKSVETTLAFVLEHKPEDVTDQSSIYKEMFYTSLLGEINRITGSGIGMPYSIFKGRPQFSQFEESYEPIYKIFADNNYGGSKRTLSVAMRGFFGLVAKIIVEYMRTNDIPVSLASCVNVMGYAPGLVDRAFPGYARAGLLHKII